MLCNKLPSILLGPRDAALREENAEGRKGRILRRINLMESLYCTKKYDKKGLMPKNTILRGIILVLAFSFITHHNLFITVRWHLCTIL